MSTGKYWDRAWSLVDGCTKVSPGCDHCWLKGMDKRFHPENLKRVTPRPDRLETPIKVKKPTIFAVWSDLFHEDVPDEFIDAAFRSMIIARPNGHRYLILTKRPERMLKYWLGAELFHHNEPWDYVYFGTTAENQEQSDKRIPILSRIPAAHRFVSIEPMIEETDLRGKLSHWTNPDGSGSWFAPVPGKVQVKLIDWVILGGETGHGARPMKPGWVRSVRDQCQAAGVPFYFKGWGTHMPGLEHVFGDLKPGLYGAITGYWNRHIDGRQWNEVPW